MSLFGREGRFVNLQLGRGPGRAARGGHDNNESVRVGCDVGRSFRSDPTSRTSKEEKPAVYFFSRPPSSVGLDVTYLDERVRICRGAGQLHVQYPTIPGTQIQSTEV